MRVVEQQVGDVVLYVDPRLARYAVWHDLTTALGWHLGPLDHPLVVEEPRVLGAVEEWMRQHPAPLQPAACDGERAGRTIMETARILVVEDDPTLVRAITRNLAAHGHAVRSAMTVAEALAALRDTCPALVLLDIDLPDGSGWEVVRALRVAGHRAVPVVVMSALRPNPRLCAELETAGELEKPFPMDALLRQVATLLEPAAAPMVSRTSEAPGDGSQG